MTVSRKWSLLATILVAAILAAGWFLLVAPKRTEAADLQKQTSRQDSVNASLEQQVQILMAQQAELPQQRAKLAVLRKQIPDNPALPTLIRNLTASGRKTGATIESLAPSLPVALAVAQPVAPVAASAPAAGETTSGESSSTTETSAASTTTPVPAAVPVAPTVFQVPLKVSVTGSYFELEQFVNRLEGLKRSFQVTGFTVEPEPESEVSGGLRLTLDGRVFLSPPASTTTPISTPVASAPAVQ